MDNGSSDLPVLIVGGGIAGLLTAWALAARGAAVTLFDQGPLPNPRSSSHDEHRITRHAYGSLQGYGRLMPAAFAAWDRLWGDLGVRHYEPTGCVFLDYGIDGWLEPTIVGLAELGIGHHDIALADIATRFPMVETRGLRRVLHSDGAGILYPQRILAAVTDLLTRRGVRLMAQTTVSAIDAEAGTLVAGGVIHRGRSVIVAAGAWVDRLVPGLRGIAVPSRQAVQYYAPPDDLAGAWSTAPVMVSKGPDWGTYTLPPRAGTRLKIGDHSFSRIGDPDEDRVATERDLAGLTAAAARGFRGIDRYRRLEAKACFYTVTADERFIVRPLGPRGIVVSACSGHGFKLAALIGTGVADAVLGLREPAGLQAWAAAS